MQAMLFNLQETASGEREFEESQVPFSISTSKIIIEGDSNSSPVESEPTSTLDSTPSPSPPTLSSSSKNSSFENAAVLAHPAQLHHGSDNVYGLLHNVTGGGDGGGTAAVGLEEWDSIFPNGDGALLPWIMGEADDLGLNLKHLLQSGYPVEYEGNAGLGGVDQTSLLGVGGGDLGFSGSGSVNNGKIGSILDNSLSGVLASEVSSNGLNSNYSSQGGMSILGSISGPLPNTGGFVFPQTQLFDVGDEKPEILNPQLMIMNQSQAQSSGNPSLFVPPLGYCQLEQHMVQPQAKRLNPGVVLNSNVIAKTPFLDQGHEFLLRKQHQRQILQQLPMGLAHQLVPQHLQQKAMQDQVVKDQLFKAADLIQTGNFSLAQEILARLNHQLSLPAKPLIRAALYVKEALQTLILMSNPVAPPPMKTLTPIDVVHKMNAYKAFSEVSPIPQFTNFTCAQAILEALNDADRVHVIDFDIGCGAQWASLIQELRLRKRRVSSLKVTAIAPLSISHTFELSLARENLVQFANDVGVAFELQVVNLDLFDPSSSSMPNVGTSEDELIAVSIPIWACSYRPSILPSILRFIKQLAPKIVVSLDRGSDRCDTPFPQHLIHILESCTNFLESLDGLNVASDIVNRVEKYFLQPKIENTVLGRVHAPNKMPHWKTLFASAGLLPVQFSNFTETQADCVVKRTPGRGFHIEKRQASLVLSWQRRELVTASAWRFEKL